MKKVGMVIVNYNDSSNTINLINNVSKYKVINKIVVVDNKSTDDSYNILKAFESDKVHIVLSENNYGYSSGINIGTNYLINLYRDCYIIVSNTDIVINNEKDIIELITNFDQEDIGVVMPQVLENGKYKKGWKLTSVNEDLLCNIPFINRFYRNKFIYYKDSYFDERCSIVDVIYGCFFIIDSRVLEEVNYFDENTFLYYEEYILARKLRKLSIKSVINNKVVIEHHHNATIGSNVSLLNKFKIYKKSQLYYEKNYNNANIFQMLLFYIFYYIGLFLLRVKLLFK